MTSRKVTADTLNENVEFDSPFIIGAQGGKETWIADVGSVYAPGVYDYVDQEGSPVGSLEIESDKWEAVRGYSSQQGYSGPEMHPSEYLGGGMARDVLADTGAIYVVCAVTNLPFWEATEEETNDVMDSTAGWVLLKLKGTGQ